MKNRKIACLLISSLLLAGCQLADLPEFSSVTEESTPVVSSDSSVSSSSSSSATPYWQEDIKTLFIGETQEDIDKYNLLVSDNDYMTVDSYLRVTTDEEGNEVSSYPTSYEDLSQYDQIVLSDTDVSLFPASTEETAEDGTVTHTDGFIDNLEKAVAEGTNLFTYGFTNGRMTLNNDVKKFSDMLPIDYDKEDEYHAVAFLIDDSGTMAEDDKLTKLKKAVINTLDRFSENDEIAVLEGNNLKIIQSITKVKDNISTITKKINNISVISVCDLNNELAKALTVLNKSSAKFKHIVAYCDDSPEDATLTAFNSTIKKLVAAGIDCSFVNIAADSGAALRMKKLASYGNGTYYYSSVSGINKITNQFFNDYVSKKAYTSTETDEEGNITPLAVNYTASGDLNIENCEVPGINGLYYASQRDNAYNILSVTNTYTQDKVDEEGNTVKDEEGNTVTETLEHKIPLLSYWEYGKGKVASFNAPLNSEWTTSFLAEDSNGLKLLKDSAHL